MRNKKYLINIININSLFLIIIVISLTFPEFSKYLSENGKPFIYNPFLKLYRKF